MVPRREGRLVLPQTAGLTFGSGREGTAVAMPEAASVVRLEPAAWVRVSGVRLARTALREWAARLWLMRAGRRAPAVLVEASALGVRRAAVG